MAWAWLEATAFTREHRIAVWLLCADLLESGFEIEHVLPVVAEVNRVAGRTTVGKLVDGLIPALESGRFREAVGQVAPPAEAMVFAAFGRADAVEVFRSAARIAQVRDRLALVLRRNLAGPVLLTLVTVGLLYGAGAGFVPALEALAPIDTWPVEAQLVGGFCLGFVEHIGVIAAVFVVAVIGVAWAAGSWAGAGRRIADRFVPFSLVRLVTGLSFVLCVVESMRAGLDLDAELFEDLAQGTTPYTRSRILAIGRRMEESGRLGRSMQETGHGFPAPELIPVIAALDGKEGWVERVGKFIDRWVERSEQVVEEGALVVNRALTTVVVLIISGASFVLFGVIQELIGGGAF